MTHHLGNISVAVLLLGATGVALAAQPVDPAAAARVKGNVNSGIASKAVGPGTLTGLGAGASEVDAGKPLAFSFTGIGHCKLTLAGGDGSTAEFEGDLPFAGNYTFGTGNMLSSEVFKNYNTTAIPQSPCSAGSKLKPVAIKVNNPMPQGVAPAGNPNTVSSSQSGKVLSPGKPGNGPVLPGVLSGITLSGKTVAGAPTLLTVAGTGNCKYHVSYVNLDAQGNTIVKQYPMVPKASSVQNPFPMTFQMIAATPAGIYKWTATAVEGCSGDVNTTFAAQ